MTFTISASLASKLASVVVHADEMLSSNEHYFDQLALQQVARDPEVQAWVRSLGPLAPDKRKGRKP